MRNSALAAGIVCVAQLCAQHRFSWQDACFNNPGLPYCGGHDFAVRPAKPQTDNRPKDVVSNAFSPRSRTGAASLVDLGVIDWRFADPFPDVLLGLNMSSLSASPLARKLITELGTSQGLTEADMQRILTGLASVDQLALSVRGNRAVVMVTGPAADSVPAPESGLKAVTTAGNALLAGHADAVDQALWRISMKTGPSELTQLAQELQNGTELWVVGSGALLGPQAVNAGVKRFTLRVSIRDAVTSDIAFELNGAPDAEALRMWRTRLGAATIEGNTIHQTMSMDADSVQKNFAKIASGPAGERLAELIRAARYIPVRNTAARNDRPVIYGLDEGPVVVGQTPAK